MKNFMEIVGEIKLDKKIISEDIMRDIIDIFEKSKYNYIVEEDIMDYNLGKSINRIIICENIDDYVDDIVANAGGVGLNRVPSLSTTIDAKINRRNEIICPYCSKNHGDKKEFIENTEPAGLGFCADGMVNSYLCNNCGGAFMVPYNAKDNK